MTATGQVHLIQVPTPKARPYGIVMDSRDRPWIVEFGTNKIATVDPKTMELTEHTLPDEASRPRRLAISPQDIIWYVDYARGFLGRFDPETGEAKEWRTPGGAESRPYAMAMDDRARLWFVESGLEPNRLLGSIPRRESSSASPKSQAAAAPCATWSSTSPPVPSGLAPIPTRLAAPRFLEVLLGPRSRL